MQRVLRLFLPAAVLFLLLAAPAMLVMGPVVWQNGLLWAISVLFFTLFVLIWPGQGLSSRLLVAVLALLFALLNTALAISFVMQGTAFNSAFYSHLDISTLKIAIATDAPRLLAAIVYIIAIPGVALLCAGRWAGMSSSPALLRGVTLASLVAALISSYPIQSIASHYRSTQQSSERLMAEIESLKAIQPAASSADGADKNLVLIYLEGVEQNFQDEELFPGLTPNLNALRDEAVWFDNIHQFPGTGWTIAGMVGSQCGVPLLSQGQRNQVLASVDNPFSQITCLAEFLRDDGFQTLYLGGATLEFAGKGRFLRDNGFNRALGLDELPDATRHKWGMYDSLLFQYGRELFDAMADGGSPFLLTMLTLDTHAPDGTPSPGCPSYGNDENSMLSSVHCSDHLVGEFVDYVRASAVADNTVIAIVSDHLIMKGEVIDDLARKDRRVNFFLLDPARDAARISGPATHFDIGPTILEALGRKDANVPFGQSLLQNASGRAFERNLTETDFEGFKIEQLVGRNSLSDGVAFFPEDSVLEIGETRYFTLDAAKVHLGDNSKKRSRFFALIFDDMDDGYPEIYSVQKWLMKALSKREEPALVLVASDDEEEFCFAEGQCQSGRYLALYDTATGQLVQAEDAAEAQTLNLAPEAITQMANGL